MRIFSRGALVYAGPTVLLFLLLFAHVTALRSIALVITTAAAAYIWRKSPGPPIPLKIPLTIWMGMALLSLTWARDAAYSLGEIWAEIGYDILCFLAFFMLTRERWQWNLFRGALLAGLTVMTGVAVWLYSRTQDLNADSALGGVLTICTHLVTMVPLLLAALFEFRGNTRVFAVGILGVIAALSVGYFTFNRNFIVAIDASGLTMALLLIRRQIAGPRQLAMSMLAVAIALVASAIFLLSVAQQRAGTESVDATVQAIVKRDPRWPLWEFSVNLIREHPLTGVGFGRFAAHRSYLEKFPEDNLSSHAHNPFLNYAVEMGIGGVTALLFLLISLLREFWKLWRCDEPQVSLIGVAGLAMVIGVLVKSQSDDLWIRQNGYLFWAVTGIMLGYAHRLRRGDRPGLKIIDQPAPRS
jgi:O-antigen ligase